MQENLTLLYFFGLIEKYPAEIEKFYSWLNVWQKENARLFSEGTDFHDLPFDMQLGIMWRFIDEHSKVKRPMAYRLPVLKDVLKGF